VREIDNFEYESENLKVKIPPKDSLGTVCGKDIANFGLISNRNVARDHKIILMKNFIFFLESGLLKIRP
jgi:hypothetical protein